MMKNKPDIRFDGFNDAWEQCELSKLASFSKGKGYTKNDLLDEGNPIILYGRLYTKYQTVIAEVDTFVDIVDDSVFSDGDEVIVPSSGETAEDIARAATVVKDGIILGGDLNIIKPSKHINSVFLAISISNGKQKKDLMTKAQGNSVVHLYNSDLKKVNVLYPEIEEQSQIGTFFQSLDNLITLHQRELENYKLIKKGFLQKLFPSNSDINPSIRFDGFTGAWEQRRLGELGSVAMNKRIFKEETSEDGDIPFFKIGTFGGNPDSYISRKKFEEYKSKYSYPEIGDLLLSVSGSIGRIVEYKGEEAYYQDSNIVWLKHDKRLINSFLKQFYSVVKWSGLEGSTIKRLYNKNILETEIKLPTIEEQYQIGTFFQSLDNLITLHQRELDNYKEFKKGFLQKMFV